MRLPRQLPLVRGRPQLDERHLPRPAKAEPPPAHHGGSAHPYRQDRPGTTQMTIALRYAAYSDVGCLREGNEDSAYAGPYLLAVADGMGGYAGGEIASSIAISTLIPLDDDVPSAEQMAESLQQAVDTANDAVSQRVTEEPQLENMGTTLTAMLWSGPRVALIHIGDSRAYLLRDSEFGQITHDHTLVQTLVDEGKISEEEAESHPQRSLLLRALDGRSQVEPD